MDCFREFRSLFLVQRDGLVVQRTCECPGLVLGPVGKPVKFAVVNLLRYPNCNIHIRQETLDSIRQKAIKIEHAHRAAHILDCLMTGIETVFPGVGEKHWDLLPTFFYFYSLSVEGSWVKELKFHLNSFFNRYLSQEAPEPIGSIHKPGTLFIGPLMRRLTQKIGKRSQSSYIFLSTILLGFKKGLPLVESSTVSDSAAKHKERLSRREYTPDWLLGEVRRTGMEIFKSQPCNEDHSYVNPLNYKGKVNLEPFKTFGSISVNSCVESFRATGGPLGLLVFESLGLTKDSPGALISVALEQPQLVEIRFHPWYGTYELRAPFIYGELANSYRFDVGLGDPRISEARSYAKFILEPLKVRTITSMGMFHNALYPEIQRQMWECLQDFPQFCLTGKPVGVRDISSLLSRTRKVVPEWFTEGKEHPLFVSGDYSGATDSCHLDLSAELINTVSNDLFVRLLLKHNLSDQKIDYSKSGLKGDQCPTEFKMTNGQLMGSRFSFPLLCVFNLAIYRYCLEKETKRTWDVKDLPVLVNGDDILFLASPELISRWESCLPLAGLEKSIGKNFVSSMFCTVNSAMFLRVGEKISEIPYLNMGLCFGMKKQPFSEGEIDRGEKQKSRFKALRGAFQPVLGLPKDIRSRFESTIRDHRADIEKSKLSSHTLGFVADPLETREEILKDLSWDLGSDLRGRCRDFRMGEERVLETHGILFGNLDEETDQSRVRCRVYNALKSWEESRVRFKWRCSRLEQSLAKGRDARKERALSGLPIIRSKEAPAVVGNSPFFQGFISKKGEESWQRIVARISSNKIKTLFEELADV